MEADMVDAVLLAHREILAPTRGVHRRMPGERKHAAVMFAAQEGGASVDGELGFRVSELAQAKGHGAFVTRLGGGEPDDQPVKVGMEFVPELCASAEQRLDCGETAFLVPRHIGRRQLHGYARPLNRAG